MCACACACACACVHACMCVKYNVCTVEIIQASVKQASVKGLTQTILGNRNVMRFGEAPPSHMIGESVKI